jgi:hypothetical protein
MILGSAITLVAIKARNKFWRKKNRNFKRKTNSNFTPGNCSSCSAECMLRNSSPQTIQHNKDLCKEIETTKIIKTNHPRNRTKEY